jgi:hypothetical protein
MSLPNLTASINELLREDGTLGHVGDDERKRALEACERLKNRLETPFEKTIRILFSVRAYVPILSRWSLHVH